MGFYANLNVNTGSESLKNMQNAISSLAEIQANTHKNVRESLNGVGNAIRDYAQYRLYKEKTQRDEEFRQKEFDEKSRQFNVTQDNEMTRHKEKLDEQKRQWDEGEPLRKAQAGNLNANAYNINLEARKRKNTLNAEEANDKAELERRKEAEKAAQKQAKIQAELEKDSQQAAASTKTPINMQKIKGAALVGGALIGVPAQRIESLF